MTKITITDPSEAAPNGDGTWTGYWSVDIEETYGLQSDPQLVASFNISSELTPDAEEPEDVAAFFEEIGEGIQAATEHLAEEEENGDDQEGE